MKKPKEYDQICKACKQLRSMHDDWSATGEFAPNVLCVTGETDAEGRYFKLCWFEPMTNLEFLEWKDANKKPS
jgi:hypothetical protein